MRTLCVCAVLVCLVAAGCGSGSNSEGDTGAVQTTAQSELSELEVGASFAAGYETRTEQDSTLPDFAWTDPEGNGKAVLDYCHDLGVTTVAAADEAFLGALVDLYYAGVLRKFGQDKYESILSFDEMMSRTANDGTDGKDRLGARIEESGDLDIETAKAKTYCPE
jgi:hypothetical protein